MRGNGLVMVTGAASGIGAAVASALVGAGRRVLAIDLDAQGLDALVSRLGAAVFAQPADVRDENALKAIVARAEDELGPIEGLVCAAGVLAKNAAITSDAATSEMRAMMSVNFEGVWAAARAVAPRMTERRRGSIVTVASNAGTTPRVGMGAYCVSKAAAIMLTRCLGLELAPHGVRCNTVSPGSTDTPMLRAMLGDASSSVLIEGDGSTFRLGIPLGRVGAPEDVAQVVLFLLSDDARHVTMQNVRVDGGATL